MTNPHDDGCSGCSPDGQPRNTNRALRVKRQSASKLPSLPVVVYYVVNTIRAEANAGDRLEARSVAYKPVEQRAPRELRHEGSPHPSLAGCSTTAWSFSPYLLTRQTSAKAAIANFLLKVVQVGTPLDSV